jgi:glycyl-tRNA synthetase beta chain
MATAKTLIKEERFSDAMALLSELRAPMDAFFEKVTVNAENSALRENRLKLLSTARASMNQAADFSLIES